MKRKLKKNIRQRAKTTHGYGSKKKHRGAGSRGGRGNAGTGKRADSKKPCVNVTEYFGRHGFSSIYKKKYHVINVGQINDNYENLKKFEKEGVLDLGALGYKKLLSIGKFNKKVSIKIDQACRKAIEKVEKSGGKVLLAHKPEPAAEQKTAKTEKPEKPAKPVAQAKPAKPAKSAEPAKPAKQETKD
jgi:large subunit ribosomal protein L15